MSKNHFGDLKQAISGAFITMHACTSYALISMPRGIRRLSI